MVRIGIFVLILVLLTLLSYASGAINVTFAMCAVFREKMLSQILRKIAEKLINVLGLLSNLFGDLLSKLSNDFEKLIDKRIFIGGLIGKPPSMFEKLMGKILNMSANLPNKFSKIFEILEGVFGDVRDNFGRNYGSYSSCVGYRSSKIGSRLCKI